MSIKSISEKTGYSYATVARALSNSGYCGAETKKRVIQAAKEIGYERNASARMLRNGRTEKILFCIPDICNAFYFRMIQGATEELHKHNYFAMIFGTDGCLKKENKATELLSQKYVDGLIMVSFDFSEKKINAIRNIAKPVVLTNRFEGQRKDDTIDYVYVDHIKGMETAANHLIERGCRRILLLTGSRAQQTASERTAGYVNALTAKGIEVDERYIVDGSFTIEGGHKAFEEFIKTELPYDGVITANDLMLMGVVRCSMTAGMDIAKKVGLVSFDNTDFAVNLGVTSVDLRQELIGQKAADLLMERITGGRTESASVYIEPELIIRR